MLFTKSQFKESWQSTTSIHSLMLASSHQLLKSQSWSLFLWDAQHSQISSTRVFVQCNLVLFLSTPYFLCPAWGTTLNHMSTTVSDVSSHCNGMILLTVVLLWLCLLSPGPGASALMKLGDDFSGGKSVATMWLSSSLRSSINLQHLTRPSRPNVHCLSQRSISLKLALRICRETGRHCSKAPTWGKGSLGKPSTGCTLEGELGECTVAEAWRLQMHCRRWVLHCFDANHQVFDFHKDLSLTKDKRFWTNAMQRFQRMNRWLCSDVFSVHTKYGTIKNVILMQGDSHCRNRVYLTANHILWVPNIIWCQNVTLVLLGLGVRTARFGTQLQPFWW